MKSLCIGVGSEGAGAVLSAISQSWPPAHCVPPPPIQSQTHVLKPADLSGVRFFRNSALTRCWRSTRAGPRTGRGSSTRLTPTVRLPLSGNPTLPHAWAAAAAHGPPPEQLTGQRPGKPYSMPSVTTTTTKVCGCQAQTLQGLCVPRVSVATDIPTAVGGSTCQMALDWWFDYKVWIKLQWHHSDKLQGLGDMSTAKHCDTFWWSVAQSCCMIAGIFCYFLQRSASLIKCEFKNCLRKLGVTDWLLIEELVEINSLKTQSWPQWTDSLLNDQ